MGGEGRNAGCGVVVRTQNWGTHVYGDTLPSKSTRSTDTVNVIFTISGYQGGTVRFKRENNHTDTRTKAGRS